MNLIKRVRELEKNINRKLQKNNVTVKIEDGNDCQTGNIKIFKNNKLDRIFEIKALNMDEFEVKEKDKILEKSLYRHNLGAFIYNLYNPVKYMYNFYGGKLEGKILTRKQVDKIAKEYTENEAKLRKIGIGEREELDNQPIVEEYYIPIYDGIEYGKIHLKYEVRGEPFIII